MGGSPMGLLDRSVPCLFLIAAMVGCSSTGSQQTSLQTAEVQEVPGQLPASTIEIRGLSAGALDPPYWQNNTLNWVGRKDRWAGAAGAGREHPVEVFWARDGDSKE